MPASLEEIRPENQVWQGERSSVYRVDFKGRPAAKKVYRFPPDLRREAAIYRRLERAGSGIQTASIYETEGDYAVFSWIEGITLRRFIQDQGEMSLTDYLGKKTEASEKIKKQLIEIVQNLHKAGIAHGNLKQSQFLVAPGGKLYLVDFVTAVMKGHGYYHRLKRYDEDVLRSYLEGTAAQRPSLRFKSFLDGLFHFREFFSPSLPEVYEGRGIWLCGYSGVYYGRIQKNRIEILREYCVGRGREELFTDLFEEDKKLWIVSLNRILCLDKESGNVTYEKALLSSHGITRLYNGWYAVARSKPDHLLTLFHPLSGQTKDVEVQSCHGVVWRQGLLYVLGEGHLRVYSFSVDQEQAHVEELESFVLPDDRGHDLSDSPGRDVLLLSTWNQVYQFDLKTRSFSLMPKIGKACKVKSVTEDSKGSLVYTYAAPHHRSISKLYFENPFHRISLDPTMTIYKARWEGFR
ncbi:MAG: hypothetical protein EXS63_05210 [Candidatus Omnitrophica bacterium]|nr:hypothetical protein [Candidatus Omnitrophota bacterium]